MQNLTKLSSFSSSLGITHYTAIYQYTLIVLYHHYKSKLNSQQKVFKTFCLPISFLLDIHIPSWKVNTIYRLLQAGYVRVDDIQNRNIYTSRFLYIWTHRCRTARKKICLYNMNIYTFLLRKKIDFILNSLKEMGDDTTAGCWRLRYLKTVNGFIIRTPEILQCLLS